MSIGREHFLTRVKVRIFPTFYGWIFRWGGKIQIEAPEEAVKEYKETAQQVLE